MERRLLNFFIIIIIIIIIIIVIIIIIMIIIMIIIIIHYYCTPVNYHQPKVAAEKGITLRENMRILTTVIHLSFLSRRVTMGLAHEEAAVGVEREGVAE